MVHACHTKGQHASQTKLVCISVHLPNKPVILALATPHHQYAGPIISHAQKDKHVIKLLMNAKYHVEKYHSAM